jgi:hypothetical protein
MKIMTIVVVCAGVTFLPGSSWAEQKKSVLDHEPELFAVVTPDRLLGRHTRRQWLDLWPVNGREYWAAWDCKGKLCDTPDRAHIRATAKLIPRTDADPKPLPADAPAPKGR